MIKDNENEVNPLVNEKLEAVNEILESAEDEKIKKVEKKKKRGRPPKSAKKIEPEKDMEALKNELSGVAEMVIGLTNQQFSERGLHVMNPAQSMLIRTGIIGCGLKYNLSMDDYPELSLLAGAGWVGYEKMLEIREIRIKKSESKKSEKDSEKKV